MVPLALCSLMISLAGPVTPVEAPSRYYFLLFAGESVPFQAKYSHTWATWVKVTPLVDGNQSVTQATISWLSHDGTVEPLRLRSEVGRNWGLRETVDHMLAIPGRVILWGPYETDARRYEAARAQIAWLESGAVEYRTLDSMTRRKDVMHCVHAVTYADPVLHRHVQPVLRVGEPGTHRLARRYMRADAFIAPRVTHDWLLPVLGLDGLNIERNHWSNPVSIVRPYR